jgi:hypothetical protein
MNYCVEILPIRNVGIVGDILMVYHTIIKKVVVIN